MYYKQFTKPFKKSMKRIVRSGSIRHEKIEFVINLLAQGQKLPEKYQDHGLLGSMEGYRECHIKPDLLLIYQIKEDILVLILINIGSHSELFK